MANAELRKKLEVFEAHELQQKREATLQERRTKIREFNQKRYKDTLGAIGELDPDSDDYDDQVAGLMAEYYADADAFAQDLGSSGELPADRPPRIQEQATAEQPTADDAAQLVLDALSSANLSQDDPVFVGFAQNAPASDEKGQALGLEAQVTWAIGKTQAHYAALRAKFNQEQHTPLQRGAAGPGGPAAGGDRHPPAREKTLDEALAEVREQRRL
jgi:hypothetical protein